MTSSLNSLKTTPKSWLQRQVLLHPNNPAFYYENSCLTFSELHHYVQRYVNYFKSFVNTQQRVAVLSENHPDLYFTILALWELGIEIQFLNTRLTSSEISYQLLDAKTKLLITKSNEQIKFENVILVPFPSEEELKKIVSYEVIDTGYQEKAVASIMYTSGTTGKPKGVPQTFANHRASSLATQQRMGVKEGDSWICCVPLYHISGLSIIMRSLVLGISIHLMPGFHAKNVNQLIVSKKTTYVSLVTKMLRDLLPFVPLKGYPGQFKHILLGGGSVELSLLESCQKKKLSVMLSYGMTETCAQVTSLETEKSVTKLGSSGSPLAGVQLTIKGTNQPYIAGEILLKGPSIIVNYLNDKGRDSWTKEGWFCTGDWGYLDHEGDLFVVSRMSERIISGGENIYPSEIETAFLKNKKVSEAIVVGKKDAIWGQRPIAYLKLKDKLNETEIKKLLQPLATYKHPDEIYVINELPKTASGKPLKRLFLTEERVTYIDYKLR